MSGAKSSGTGDNTEPIYLYPLFMYPAKVLLFGEYLVLLGVRALTLPLERFGGEWAWNSAEDGLREELRAFAHSEAIAGIPALDALAFRQEAAQGLFFRSNIPRGYGLGSSGALCAAVYDRYATIKTDDLIVLKQLFARMEAFFHGRSSGIDPLTSYVRRPLLVRGQEDVRFFEQQPWHGPTPAVFLFDTGQERQTGPLVQWFVEQCRRRDFAARIEDELLPTHEALIEAWQTGASAQLWPLLRRLSAFQLQHWQPMIPEQWRPLWTELMASDEVLFKICGAGGGGFLLLFGRTAESVQRLLGHYAPIRIL